MSQLFKPGDKVKRVCVVLHPHYNVEVGGIYEVQHHQSFGDVLHLKGIAGAWDGHKFRLVEEEKVSWDDVVAARLKYTTASAAAAAAQEELIFAMRKYTEQNL